MAKRIRFVRPYIYTPSAERRVATAYKPTKHAILVTEECAERALAGGYAVLPPQGEAVQPGAPLPAARNPAKRTSRARRARPTATA